MPLTRFEGEEIGPGRWVGWVELPGTSPVRKDVRGTSFDETILALVEARASMVSAPTARPVKEVLADQHAREAAAKAAEAAADDAAAEAAHASRLADDAATAEAAATEASAERMRQDEAGAPVASSQRDALIAQAEGMGLAIDRRWGDARLRDVVEAEHARRAASA